MTYEEAFRVWLASVARRADAVRAGRMSKRVAAKRNAEQRAIIEHMHERLMDTQCRGALASLTFRSGRWPSLRSVRSLAYIPTGAQR